MVGDIKYEYDRHIMKIFAIYLRNKLKNFLIKCPNHEKKSTFKTGLI
jgi:hypothetical protein